MFMPSVCHADISPCSDPDQNHNFVPEHDHDSDHDPDHDSDHDPDPDPDHDSDHNPDHEYNLVPALDHDHDPSQGLNLYLRFLYVIMISVIFPFKKLINKLTPVKHNKSN